MKAKVSILCIQKQDFNQNISFRRTIFNSSDVVFLS